jgi:hypothetical protein
MPKAVMKISVKLSFLSKAIQRFVLPDGLVSFNVVEDFR